MGRVLRWSMILLGALGVLLLTAVILLILLVDPDSKAAQLPERLDVSPLSRYATVPLAGTDGITLHYLETGRAQTDGPLFMLLHGFTFNAFTWQMQLGQLAKHGRVIALDQLPYGLGEKPRPGEWEGHSPYARAAAVALVRGLLDHLDADQVILVGNSSGGTLAMEVALAEPQRVAGLILVAPWAYVQRPVLPRWLVESLPLERLSLFAARQLGERMPLLVPSFADPERIPEGRMAMARIHTQTHNWDLAWAALLRESLTARIAVAQDLGRIEQATLVVSGDEDRLVPANDSQRLASELPNARFQRLVGCGHVAHEECPVAFAIAVEQWLRDHAGVETQGVVP